MSRIGKLPIVVPDAVKVELHADSVTVSGPKGVLSIAVMPEANVTFNDKKLIVAPSNDSTRAKAMWGLLRSLLFNAVCGVNEGWKRRLEISGIGYRAAVNDDILTLNLGYSHDVMYAIPSDNVAIHCEKNTSIVVSGCDKQLVGQVAAEIRQLRKPEPYKGKGIRYDDEVVRRKEGKKK